MRAAAPGPGIVESIRIFCDGERQAITSESLTVVGGTKAAKATQGTTDWVKFAAAHLADRGGFGRVQVRLTKVRDPGLVRLWGRDTLWCWRVIGDPSRIGIWWCFYRFW